MHGEILSREEEGWVWRDDRVPVEEAFETAGEAVQAGLAAIEAQVAEDRIPPEEAAELVSDARFELGANEHHLGGQDSKAIEALAGFEDQLRGEA